MTLGGSTPANPAAIDQLLAGRLQFPGEVPPANPAPVQPQAPAVPTPQPQVAQSVSIPNVQMQALSDAAAAVDIPNFATEEEQATEPVAEPVVEEDTDLEEVPEAPARANFKRLQEVAKTERKARKELEAKIQEATAQLEQYKKGEVIPDIVQAKDQRIAELEPYEAAVNLKLSPQYQKEFVQPAIELRGQLEQIATDYGLPMDVMHQAVQTSSRKELNQFLAQYFDEVGALEVKEVVSKLQTLGEKALEAEQNPKHSLEALRAQYAEKEQAEALKVATIFESTAKEAWNAALQKTAQEGVYKEFILHPTNTEYNKKVVEPIQHRASIQFGALVKQLRANGLKQLPGELASGLARMVLLSIGGALTLDEKAKAVSRADTIMQNTARTNTYVRPPVGGQIGSSHAARAVVDKGPTNPMEAGKRASEFFKNR